jgi:hypothetical protein
MRLNVSSHIECLDSTDLGRLYAYWEAKRRGRRMPTRADIDPLDFTRMVGRISMVDVLGDAASPTSFRFRLAATPICRALGYEMTGRSLEEMRDPATRAFLTYNYVEVAQSATPLVMCGAVRLDGRDWRGECLILPLSTQEKRVERLLVARDVSVWEGSHRVRIGAMC